MDWDRKHNNKDTYSNQSLRCTYINRYPQDFVKFSDISYLLIIDILNIKGKIFKF